MAISNVHPDYLFEISWEVCNKIGGIHTVISTKADVLLQEYGQNLVFIGPDVWRDDAQNPEFTEEPDLFSDWKKAASDEGLNVHVTRWNIRGNPVVVLVDFTTFINNKDEIFSRFWELYKLDSLSGQWDYIEPALFGYAAGKVIESFVKFNLNSGDNIVAHFHEWMTGTGILYLNHFVPEIATVFTAHSTVIGKTLALNDYALYKNMGQYRSDDLARQYNLISKHSLEKLSSHVADTFTTISKNMATECAHFLNKKVDLVTPNGFVDSFCPSQDKYKEGRIQAREKILNVVNHLLDHDINDQAMLVAISGRYECRNKGIDLFIDTMRNLNRSGNLKKDIVAMILVPANHIGPRQDLLKKLNDHDDQELADKILTHNLNESELDPIYKHIKDSSLLNSKSDKVKIIYVPANLGGGDGIFNMEYYKLLIGFDLTLFPSYYEPWGYTPVESLCLHVPTVTSSLTGFGNWVSSNVLEKGKGIRIIQRNDDDYNQAIDELVKIVEEYSGYDEEEYNKAREQAFALLSEVLWDKLIDHYKSAYQDALNKARPRKDEIKETKPTKLEIRVIKRPPINEPMWNDMIVKSNLTKKLIRLEELSKNLWWSWNSDAINLFERIDPALWEEMDQNPVRLLENVELKRFHELEKDKDFMEALHSVLNQFDAYLNKEPEKGSPKIAYFSMEFGIHNTLKIYSGGLGILAGDYLKEASDSRIDMVGVSILYKFGYFNQILSVNGEQQADYTPQTLSHLPIEKVYDKDGNWLCVQIVLPGRSMTARIWRVNVGRVPLYLLDTDFDVNQPQDRYVSHHLYGGDNENRLKQELLLGIGGIRALDALGYNFDIYHSNEGHSAFIGLERLRKLIKENNLSFEVAKELVRSTTLFTTHTPVPAGHDSFTEDLLRIYIAHYPERLKITWDELMALGRYNPFNKEEKFSMSVLAAHLSQAMNGVSALHGKVSQKMFAKLWSGYLPEENHIGHVTNGVHLGTWVAKEWKELYIKEFDEGFMDNQSDKRFWKKIHKVPDEKIWDIKQRLKEKLYMHIRERFMSNWIKRHDHPRAIVDILESFNKESLTIGFARRFATYKRADLLFRNIERLSDVVNDLDKPVQFLFAGKAHPHDKGGQALIKRIVEISKMPEFTGKVIFLQNYDMSLAQKLVSGVDIWLNTPTRPLEASGTSGEKAVMNGTIHFSVLDGWWVEGYQPNAGWALTDKRSYENQEYQNELDAETIYYILENEIVPMYYDRDKNGVPHNWIQVIKNSISDVAPKFTMKRMIDDYTERYYSKLHERSRLMFMDDYKMAKDVALWKKMVIRNWDNIEVVSLSLPEDLHQSVKLGENFISEVLLDLKGLLPDEVGVEFIIVKRQKDNTYKLIQKKEYSYIKDVDTNALYKIDMTPAQPGTFQFGIRLFPKNKNLANRQDIGCVKWI